MVKDKDGNASLHYIAALGRDSLLKHFFKALRHHDKETRGDSYSVDPLDMRNNFEETASNLARNNGHLGLLRLITEEKMRFMVLEAV